MIPDPIKQPPAPKPKPIAEKEPVIDVMPEDILLKSNRKHKHVVDILRQLGLKPLPRKHRGKGDHEIWRDPSGHFGQAVVPDHKEIAEGTRRSIVKQLNAPPTEC